MRLEEEYRLSCYEELTEMGGNPKVHLVKDVRTGDILIKKEIQAEVEPVYQRLRQEKIRGIPEIYDLIEGENEIFVIEAYIHGSSLEKILDQKGKLEDREVAETALAVCRILKRLHEQENPVIHRDIKPSNLMISAEGSVYLIDFDAARVYSEEKQTDTRLLGTKRYAPPEQYGFGQSDARSDLYALGVTLNMMITGSYPDEELPEGAIGDVISRCIRWEPEERYQTAGELEQDLEKICDPQKDQNEETPLENTGQRASGIVGFRSKVPWKMALAVLGYLFLVFVCLRMEIMDSNGVPLSGGRLWLERVSPLMIFLASILYLGNFAGLREKSFGKWKENRRLCWVFAAVWVIGIIFFGLACMLIIEGIIWGQA